MYGKIYSRCCRPVAASAGLLLALTTAAGAADRLGGGLPYKEFVRSHLPGLDAPAALQRSRALPANMEASVFGSVAIPFGPIPSAGRWDRVLAERAAGLLQDKCSGQAAACDSDLVRRLNRVRSTSSGAPLAELVQAVNSEVNRVLTYRSDRQTYGRRDHWATLTETALKAAGDCEDFAIAKMWALSSAGVPLHSMQLAIVQDDRRGRYHAVLVVRAGGERLVLDSTRDAVRPDTQIAQYAPIYSLGPSGSWIHGYKAEDSVPIASVNAMPGEPSTSGDRS